VVDGGKRFGWNTNPMRRMIAQWETASGRLNILPAQIAGWITPRPRSRISISIPAGLNAGFA
jgi:hypothetical protein